MEIRSEDITIAITVFSRREFVLAAIRSALEQTIPVKVIVVEDHGPDEEMREFITSEFGDQITYFRNIKNRGLFDNWNACLEYCQTSWLSILHDDDMLQPNFVETMLSLAHAAPDRAIYFGNFSTLDEQNQVLTHSSKVWKTAWEDLNIAAFAEQNSVLFPGHLLRVDRVRQADGFCTGSYFTGDWDMWFRLAVKFGAAQSATVVSIVRSHVGDDRGTTRVERMGWKWALDNAQRKRNLILLKQEKGITIPFDRLKLLKESPIPLRLLLRYSRGFSRRILVYNWWLFIHSSPFHWRYTAFQWMARIFGPKTLRLLGHR